MWTRPLPQVGLGFGGVTPSFACIGFQSWLMLRLVQLLPVPPSVLHLCLAVFPRLVYLVCVLPAVCASSSLLQVFQESIPSVSLPVFFWNLIGFLDFASAFP